MIADRNTIKDLGRLFFWYPVRWLVLILPLKAVYVLSNILGDIDYAVSNKNRIKRMLNNISRVFNETPETPEQILRKNLRNHIRTVLEFIKYPQLNSKNIQRIASFDGIEHLDKELARGKGVILATSHFGAKQLLQVALGHQHYNINQINYHMNGDELSFVQKNIAQRLRVDIEKKIPCNFISAKGFMRQAFECLKKNEILIIAADGSGIEGQIDKSYIPITFLGEKMLFPTNVIKLASRTGASVVPVFAERIDEEHVIAFEPALMIEDNDHNKAVEQYASVLEKHIRTSPHLWEFWEEFQEGHLLVSK